MGQEEQKKGIIVNCPYLYLIVSSPLIKEGLIYLKLTSNFLYSWGNSKTITLLSLPLVDFSI